MTHLNDYFSERDREQSFIARHGKAVLLSEGVRVFETGGCIISELFTGRLVFHEPAADPLRKMKVQRDWYSMELAVAERRFRALKGALPSQMVRIELLEIQNLVLAYRQKLEQIDSALNYTPERREAIAQAQRNAELDYELARQRDTLQAAIDRISIDD